MNALPGRMLAFFLIPELLGIFAMAARPSPRVGDSTKSSEEGLPGLQLSLEEYVDRALNSGVAGRENQWTLESAGYQRQVTFLSTEAPALTLTHQQSATGSATGGIPGSRSESRLTGLALDETTPLGTKVSATGGYGDTYGTSAGAALPSNGLQPTFSVTGSQPLYLFVRNPVARQRILAQLTFENAQSNFESTRLSIRAQARNFYYGVMQQEESIQVARRKADSSKKLLDVTQALVDAGKSAPVDAMRAKITLQTDLRALENAVTLRDQSVLNAKNYIFLPLDEPVEFTSRLDFRPFLVSVDRLINYALLHQPELQTFRRARELALINYQQAIEPTRPTLSIDGSYNYAQTATLFANTAYTRGWTWALNAGWRFFDSGVTANAVREARIGELVADLNLANGERTTQLNVRNSYLDVKRTEKQINDFESQREQARHNVDVLRLRFQNGLATLIDVITAENDMRDLDNTYLTLLVQFNVSKDALTQQLGADVDSL